MDGNDLVLRYESFIGSTNKEGKFKNKKSRRKLDHKSYRVAIVIAFLAPILITILGLISLLTIYFFRSDNNQTYQLKLKDQKITASNATDITFYNLPENTFIIKTGTIRGNKITILIPHISCFETTLLLHPTLSDFLCTYRA